MMTFRSNFNPFDKANYDNFAFKKSEILEILQTLNGNFSFDQTMQETVQKTQHDNIQGARYDYKILLFKKPLLSQWDAASIISDTDPVLLSDLNEYEAGRKYPDWMGALNFIDSSISAGLLERNNFSINCIKCDDLKEFLTSQNIVIDGFNNYLKNKVMDQSLDNQNSIIDQLKKENEKLKTELLNKNQKIKELELIQTTVDESKLGNTRAENNVAKLILVLSEQANIDTSKPYAQYESLRIQAELLGIDKFPSDENVATWLKRANSQNPN